MRIASHEVTISTLIHAALVVGLCLFVLVLAMRSYSTTREAWRRGEILGALSETADGSNAAPLEQGIAACDALIAADPARSAPPFYKGCIYSKLGKYPEAKSAFEQAASARDANPEEKSAAWAAAASAAALDGAKDGRPAKLDEALKLVQKALEAKATPDALAAEAILKSWQDGTPDSQLSALLEKALAATPAPAAPALEQLYRLQGTLKLRARKPSEARDDVARVKAVNPFNTQVGEVGRNAQLSAIMDTSLDPAVRRAQIENVNATSQSFGPRRPEALLAVALAWHSFTSAPDYLAPEGPFVKARTVLSQLIQSNPKDVRPFRLLAAMLEERIDLLSKELSVPISGLSGEAPRSSIWDDAKKPDEYSKEDLERLTKIRQLSADEETLWQRFAEQSTDKKERIDAKTRQLLALRRQVWSTRAVEAAWRDSLQNKALTVAQDLSALDDSGKGQWLLALVQIDRDNLGAAFSALNEARKRGFKSPEADKLFAQFLASSEMIDHGPVPTERQFGAVQLIRATLKVPEGAALTNVNLEVDGKQVGKSVVNTQVFSLLDDKGMTGAAHTVKLSAETGSGGVVTFPEFSLSVDKNAPVWKLSPPAGEPNPAQVWQIELKDATGVDWGKLHAGIRAGKTQGAVISDMLLIKDGRYTRALATAKVKNGDIVAVSPFALGPPNTLPAGEYKLWIEVPDTLGNVLKDEKSFTIK